MSPDQFALLIVNAISDKAKSFELKEISVSFESGVILVEIQGRFYRLTLEEVRAWRQNVDNDKG